MTRGVLTGIFDYFWELLLMLGPTRCAILSALGQPVCIVHTARCIFTASYYYSCCIRPSYHLVVSWTPS